MDQRVIDAIKKGYFDIPFYQDACAKAGMPLSEVCTQEQFLKIPFTVKDDLRNTSPYERTRTDPKDIFGLYSSSGTTGKKTFYIHSRADHEKQDAYSREFFTRAGLKAGNLGAIFGPIESPIMGHCMMWQFHAINVGVTLCPRPSPENILDVITQLPVTDIATLPQIASFPAGRSEWRTAAKKSTVQRLLLGGDFISDVRRNVLEEVWDAEVFNCFGMSEIFGPIGIDCQEKNGFHYHDEDIYLEIVSPETGLPVPVGEIGVGVYTTLWDKGFPLLRYWSGDLLRLVSEPCTCGCKLPRFDYFGRYDDCVKLPDGRWVSPRQMEEFTLKEKILHCQLQIQQDKSALFVYDKDGVAPSDQLLRQMRDLLEGAEVTAKPLPLSEINLRGLKPKYMLDTRG